MGKTRKQYRDSGSHYACDKVHAEGDEVRARWEAHLEVLRTYGKGRQALDAFTALLVEHAAAMAARPDAVAAKLAAVSGSANTTELANEVIDKARSILGDVSKTNAAVEQDLTAALAADGKAAVVAALANLLTTHRALLPEDCEAETLARQGQELATALRAAIPAKADAKIAAKSDTEEIDVLDGRLLEIIAEVNSVGRKAFRRLRNKALVEAFKYHHVKGKPSETAPQEPTRPS